MNCSTPGLPVHHQLLESTQTHVHQVDDAIQSSHPLSSPSPPALNLSQHQGLFQWVSSLHQVAKVLECQLQHQSFQWTPRTDLLQDGLVGPPCSRRDPQESSPTPQFKTKASILWHQGLFNESVHIRWPKYWSFSFSISPSNEYSGLISLRIDWINLLAVQGTLKRLLQHHSSKTSILQHSTFVIVQLSHPYMTTGKAIALTTWTFVGKVMSLFLICYLIWS